MEHYNNETNLCAFKSECEILKIINEITKISRKEKNNVFFLQKTSFFVVPKVSQFS